MLVLYMMGAFLAAIGLVELLKNTPLMKALEELDKISR